MDEKEIKDVNIEEVSEPKLEENEVSEEVSVEEKVLKKTKETKETSADINLVTVQPVEFQTFDTNEGARTPRKNLDILQDIKMRITVELGRAKLNVRKILEMSKGSIVELNKVAGESVELYVNGKLVALGEVIVIEDKFGLRVTSIAQEKII